MLAPSWPEVRTPCLCDWCFCLCVAAVLGIMGSDWRMKAVNFLKWFPGTVASSQHLSHHIVICRGSRYWCLQNFRSTRASDDPQNMKAWRRPLKILLLENLGASEYVVQRWSSICILRKWDVGGGEKCGREGGGKRVWGRKERWVLGRKGKREVE